MRAITVFVAVYIIRSFRIEFDMALFDLLLRKGKNIGAAKSPAGLQLRQTIDNGLRLSLILKAVDLAADHDHPFQG